MKQAVIDKLLKNFRPEVSVFDRNVGPLRCKKEKPMNAIWIVLPILTLLMFELGLTLNLGGFALLARRPAPVVAGMLGQIVLLPVLAFGLGWAFDLEPVFFVGLVLIACSPGGSSSNVFSMVARGDVPLSILLTALSSSITLFTIPIIMRLAVRFAGDAGDVAIRLPVGSLIAQNLLLVLLPVVVGVVLRRVRPLVAEKIHVVLSKISLPALMLLAAIFFAQHYDTILAQMGRLGACIALLILLAMGGGWALSRLWRVGEREQRTLIIEIGMQNAAQAIAVATSPFIFACDAMAIPAIVYALLMNVILLAYIGILKRRRQSFTNC